MFEKFIEKLKKDKFITLETTPAHSPTFDPIIEKIESLKLYEKIDGFSATDNPLAKLKYNSIIAAFKLQSRFKKPVLATMTMRDRNKLALQSDLLGANDIDVRAILALTGDPASASDQPKTKGVFEGNSNLLLDIIKCFNAGIDYAGKPFFEKPKKIYPFAVSNAYSKNSKNILKKMIQKIEHGAFGIITQPVYDIDNAKLLIELFEKAKKEAAVKQNEPVLIFGFFPVVKLRTAQFLTSHVPGVYVPKMWVDKLYKAKKISDEEEERVGFELSLDTFLKLYQFHPKIHLMTANNFSLAKKLLDMI